MHQVFHPSFFQPIGLGKSAFSWPKPYLYGVSESVQQGINCGEIAETAKN